MLLQGKYIDMDTNKIKCISHRTCHTSTSSPNNTVKIENGIKYENHSELLLNIVGFEPSKLH